MKNAVLFDLGNTLVEYFERAELPDILAQSVAEVLDLLRQEGLSVRAPESIWQRLQEEDHEDPDHRVRLLEERLARIFPIEGSAGSDELLLSMCQRFLKPVYARARRYEDTLAVLHELRSRGFKTAIVSNTTWGSPARLWREEIERHGLSDLVDVAVFCTDVGWRKPAPRIFEFVLEKLQASPEQCIFVGDHPKWDVAGARAAGMEAILIDRGAAGRNPEENPIQDLYQLCDRLGVAVPRHLIR